MQYFFIYNVSSRKKKKKKITNKRLFHKKDFRCKNWGDETVKAAYDGRACKFNMDIGCVELLLRNGRKISIDCTGVEDALDVTMEQQTELDYLIYNDPLGYADLILNGDPEEYLKNVTGSHGLED